MSDLITVKFTENPKEYQRQYQKIYRETHQEQRKTIQHKYFNKPEKKQMKQNYYQMNKVRILMIQKLYREKKAIISLRDEGYNYHDAYTLFYRRKNRLTEPEDFIKIYED